jgi:hypothetical protein
MQSLGLALIIFIYANIAAFTAAGTIYLSQKLFEPGKERYFYAFFLFIIAIFYLSFILYYGDDMALQNELYAIVLFAVLACMGAFSTKILIVGYVLHAVWDFVHEFQQSLDSVLSNADLISIPLGYGVFCLVFDLAMAVYFYTRRRVWS